METSANECRCKDCNEGMDLIKQDDFRGGHITLITCWNKQCLLYAVTLSVGQFAALAPETLEDYRNMNRTRNRKQPAIAS